jgi:Ca2+-binding RTX toxin-like protein
VSSLRESLWRNPEERAPIRGFPDKGAERTDELLSGGEGNDIVGKDDDFGNDLMQGGSGTDALNGGPGFDRLQGGSEADVCINGEINESCNP